MSSLVEAIIWDSQSKMQEKVTCEMELLLSQPSRKSNPNQNLGQDGPHNWSEHTPHAKSFPTKQNLLSYIRRV